MRNVHTTNYYNTFIEIAEDSPVKTGEVPPEKAGGKTIANMQFDMLYGHPYKFTSDDALFGTFAQKQNITGNGLAGEREAFFSKGQACFRSSPLTNRYGWGVHSNAEGRIAIYAAGSDEYKKLAADKSLKQVKAMRSKKA